MTRFPRLLGGCATAAVLAVTACTADAEPEPEAQSSATDAPLVQLGAPGEPNRTLSPGEVAGQGAPAHTAADVAFFQGMIPHHRQALEMTALVGERTASEQVPRLAERIEVSQTDEIALFERWLTEREAELPDEHAHHGGDHGGDDGHVMPGMLTEDELAQLGAATGARFDRLFLQYMIRHHEGALLMVQELYAADGGQDPEASLLAEGVASDQQVEISRMKRMLVALPR